MRRNGDAVSCVRVGLHPRYSRAQSRPAVVCDDAHDLDISGLRATAAAAGQPIIALHDVSDIFVYRSKASKDTPTFVQVSGASSTGIVLSGHDLSHAAQPVVLKDGAVAASISSRCRTGSFTIDLASANLEKISAYAKVQRATPHPAQLR
jgi:hypothetical protein